MRTFSTVLVLVVGAIPLFADDLWLRSGERVTGIWQGGDGDQVQFLTASRDAKSYDVGVVKAACFTTNVTNERATAYSRTDELVLPSGRTVTGNYQRSTSDTIYFSPAGRQETTYRIADVECLRFQDRQGPAAAATADELQMRNGAVYRGTLIGADARQVRFLTEEGETRSVAVSDVASIRFAVATETASTGVTAGRSVPQGTAVTVRLIDPINASITETGATYAASVDTPVNVNQQEIVPRGADALVQVVEAKEAGRLQGQSMLTLQLHSITLNGRRYTVATEYATVAGQGQTRDTALKTAGLAGLGAIIGGIAGGGTGAAIGAASGAGAGVAVSAMGGGRLELPSETRLEFILAEPLLLN
ncbi:MAG: hypothetical protein JXB13_07750 [Phycisphaerae bacterium]|nr:hypothetical protein [Phycisphaerae bacterium]